MAKFEVKKITDKKFFLEMIQGDDEFMISNGMSFEKKELYELYIKLRDIFTTNEK